MEPLIYSEVPAAQGGAAIFNGGRPLKMKESENHIFRFPCSENSRMELFRASLSYPFGWIWPVIQNGAAPGAHCGMGMIRGVPSVFLSSRARNC